MESCGRCTTTLRVTVLLLVGCASLFFSDFAGKGKGGAIGEASVSRLRSNSVTVNTGGKPMNTNANSSPSMSSSKIEVVKVHGGGTPMSANGSSSSSMSTIMKASIGTRTTTGVVTVSPCKDKELLDANARRKIHERSEWILNLPSTNAAERKAMSAMHVDTWTVALLFSSYYPCLWTLERTESVVEGLDGGKWVCGFRELAQTRPEGCIVYSIGSNFDNTFEVRLSKDTAGKCNIHIYDPTMGGDRKKLGAWTRTFPPNMHFHEFAIVGQGVSASIEANSAREFAAKKFPSLTLSDAFKQNGHEAGVDVLKFDIEGFEYELLEYVEWTKLKIGFILFEYHPDKIAKRLHQGNKVQDLDRQLARLENAGYRVYSVEPVCSAYKLCIGRVEFGLIHRDWDPHCGFDCGSA
mmetsp:Transcript_90815/g.256494  ORF Transcript_90815/g.256494 Transcript_90815/m.256494 type:complete len:409 (-) Transcript_90815:108-1334(-)